MKYIAVPDWPAYLDHIKTEVGLGGASPQPGHLAMLQPFVHLGHVVGQPPHLSKCQHVNHHTSARQCEVPLLHD